MARTEKWTIDLVREGFKRFVSNYGHAPTSAEIDSYEHLPTARQLQRKFPGGLPKLREELGVKGPSDFTKGKTGSQRGHNISLEHKRAVKDLLGPLVDRYGAENVRPQFGFTDDRRTRVDFFILARDGYFCVDAVCPKDIRSLAGCLNRKLHTYAQPELKDKDVVFVVMNELVHDADIEVLLGNKTLVPSIKQKVVSRDAFGEYCAAKAPLPASRKPRAA